MIRIVGNEKARALSWAFQRWGMTETSGWDRFSAQFLEKDGDIQAAVLYKNYIPTNSIELHLAAVAGGRWLTRPFLRAAFAYPFEQLGVRRIATMIAADNIPSRRFTEHAGWKLSGVISEGWSETVDLLIYSMRKRECRFLGKPNEQAGDSDASRSRDDSGGADDIQSRDREEQRGTQPRQHKHALRVAEL